MTHPHTYLSEAARVLKVGSLSLLTALAVSACGVFGDKPKPAALENYTPALQAAAAWRADGPAVTGSLRAAGAAERVAIPGADGSVTVRRWSDGQVVWRARAGQPISAGVGFDGERAAVVTQSNDLIVLQGGGEVWRKRLSSRVATPPLVAGERVFVMGMDRAVEAYDASNGRYLWRLQRTTDPLALELPSVLAPLGNTLLVGQGSRLAGVDPTEGRVRWEIPLATPRGTNEVERLSDLVGPPVRVGADVVCARAFQSAVSCADVRQGALKWTRNIGGVQPVGGGADAIVGGDASDRLSAWRTETGELLWSHERLLHRGLGGVAAWGPWAAVGDAQGIVHVLRRQNGETVLRLTTDGSAVVGAPVVVDGSLMVVTRKGGVYAWRLP